MSQDQFFNKHPNWDILSKSWPTSKEATAMTLKYGPELVHEYCLYLEQSLESVVTHFEDEEPMDFELWLECFEEDIDWFNSDEFQNLVSNMN